MSDWTRVAASILQVAAVAVGGPLLLGLMGRIRARAEGRVGPPVTQHLRDLRKLVRKETIRAEHTSAVSALAPLVLVASAAVAAAVTPLVTTRPVAAGGADVFVVVYLLLMGSVALALGGLDAGTAFGGMGSSRAMTIGAISEPALLVGILALAVQARTSNLPGIVAASLAHPGWLASPQRLVALAALVVVVVAETGRIPVDNPSTHLELTMIHEAMVLEQAGPDLALVGLGEAMRLGLLLGLVANLFFPWGVDASGGGLAVVTGLVVIGLVVLGAKAAVLGALIALVEVSTAKLRLFRVPELLAGGFVLAVVAVTAGLVTR
ncbi:MAG: NADH-quinone oxidoreductase subunit H [Actinomycetota bacterium]|jgi:formate hydrogenlyase subunit 4|nr:NADH-quinone oxidoreductase subunit H [Actinomycetota bacterium]